MRSQTLISALYGELRGYRRLSIRRQVAANERLTRDALMALAEESFQHHIHRTIARFPFYAERVKAYRGSLPRPGETVRAEELPVWTRSDQVAFFAQESPPSDSQYVHETGGSTGKVARFHITRESYEWRTAIMDRVYAWAGAEEGARSLHIWAASAKISGPAHEMKRAVQLALQRRTYFDANRVLSDRDRALCCELINRTKPLAIVGYAGMLVDIARYARDHGALEWRADSLISTAEGLQCGQREVLQTHLARRIFDSYGSREFMNIGTECALHSGYHLATDNLWVEVVDANGNITPPGVEGRIVVTDFNNAATPFIRYEIGDLGVMAPPDDVCACGRPFPLLRRVEGRTQDTILTARGQVSALNFVDALEQVSWIEGYQMVQPAGNCLTIRLLTQGELTAERETVVRGKLRDLIGEMNVSFERVRELTRRPNGKVEVVVSALAAAQEYMIW